MLTNLEYNLPIHFLLFKVAVLCFPCKQTMYVPRAFTSEFKVLEEWLGWLTYHI